MVSVAMSLGKRTTIKRSTSLLLLLLLLLLQLSNGKYIRQINFLSLYTKLLILFDKIFFKDSPSSPLY